MPVIARNVLESVRLLAASSRELATRCVDGITADADRMRTYAESSPSVVTPLNKHLGYEEAAKVAKAALAEAGEPPVGVASVRSRAATAVRRDSSDLWFRLVNFGFFFSKRVSKVG